MYIPMIRTSEVRDMSLIEAVIGPLGSLLDKIIPDPKERNRAKVELLALQGSQDMEALKAQLSAILAEAQSPDPWTSRARPSFLYVMYVIILWALPMGLIAAFWPGVASGIAKGMNGYLGGIPESLWALFGTGYLGYTAARQWGKVKGVER
jgi:Holin of 3TMs, for gene-transfer release